MNLKMINTSLHQTKGFTSVNLSYIYPKTPALTDVGVASNTPLLGYSISEILRFRFKLQEIRRIATELRISRSIRSSHGMIRKNTESKPIIQSRMRKRRFFLAEANTTFYCISLQACSASKGSSNTCLLFTHYSFACASGL